MEYQAEWRKGFASLYKEADAQKVADEIVSIGQSATPEQILDKARDPDTELHKCFEWDDSIAAQKYRIVQARNIVRLLVIRTTTTEEIKSPPIRVFYKTDASDGYKPTQVIMRNQDEYQSLLRRALSELISFKSKYKSLTELDGLFEEIDKLTA